MSKSKPFFKVYCKPALKEKLKYYSRLYGTNQSEVINMLVSDWLDGIEKTNPLSDRPNISDVLTKQQNHCVHLQ